MVQEFKKLYSSRKDGKTQVWHIELDGDQYRVITGQMEGNTILPSSIVPSAWKQAIPTNVGRSNERNGEAQAEFEIKALYKSRMEQGAVENIGNAPMRPDQIKPMLAQKYATKEITFPVYSQPKLDGARAIVTSEGAFSRTWKPIISAPHIHEDLKSLLNHGYIFDGEYYNHDLKNDFEKIMSLIRKSKPTDSELAESKELVKYYIFDLIGLDDMPFSERLNLLKSMDLPPSCVVVDALECNSFDEIDQAYGEYLEDGYEGQMIRKNSKYEYTRSKALLKRKEFDDSEFEIIKIIEGTGNWAGTAKVVFCRDDKGVEFKATLKGSYEAGKEILEEAADYVGGEATVRYQKKTNKNEVPRFPVVTAIYKGKRDI